MEKIEEQFFEVKQLFDEFELHIDEIERILKILNDKREIYKPIIKNNVELNNRIVLLSDKFEKLYHDNTH